MQDKLISFDSCVSIFQPDSQRSFGTVAPVNVISGPEKPLLYSWMGSVSFTSLPSISFGTIDRWRYDPNDSMPLNRDQWVLWSTGTANLIRVKEVEKFNVPEHRADTLPTEIKNSSPSWVGSFLGEMIKSE